MNEYQISVSLNGVFMFRTEWDDDKQRVGANAVAIKTSMPLCKVRVMSRSKLMSQIDPASLLS